MRDISELPGGSEQAKPQTKTKVTARSKSENATTSSQVQQAKAPSRQRTNSTTQSTIGTSGPDENEHATTSRSTVAQSSTANPSTPRPSRTHSTTQESRASAQRTTSDGQTATGNRPAAAQRTGRAQPRQANASYQQRSPQNRPPQSGTASQTAQRPAQQTDGTAASSGRPGRPATTGTRSAGSGRSSSPSTRPGVQKRTGSTPGARPAARSNKSTARSQERRAAPVKEKPTGPISLPPQIIVKDLAETLNVSATEVIRTLIKHSIFANINEVVDYEKAALVAQEIGYEPTPLAATTTAVGKDRPLSASDAMIASRKEGQTVEVPPVVTIMGHVDHGKTSLLDTIRKTKVAINEAGGITQHIGAYQVEINGKKITFLDTPGHEAFTAMRARGAQVTHIAIIVVAADDGIMPQTIEAIDHAKAANVPIIIALNKIDKANANPDRVKQQLADIGILIEEYGGETVCVPVSARKSIGIDELLEYILLVAEIQDIQADPNGPTTGVIIEAKLEKNTGVIASVLVQQGTLKMGDTILVGAISGKVRAMFNDRGKRIQKAPPSTPVSILGLSEVPQAGDRLEVVNDERTAKQRAQQEAEKRRNEAAPLGQVSLDTLYMQMQKARSKS